MLLTGQSTTFDNCSTLFDIRGLVREIREVVVEGDDGEAEEEEEDA